jgi:anaerobic selenocysteine-containing dehydrogenase/Fe-S-cluster-containing dehydrogenase component
MERRAFFKVLAGTGMAAATSGCTPVAERLLPQVVPNDQIVPGVPAFFATVCRECPGGCGALAENHDGRVTKLEGNPDHPQSRGALCARGQAAVQGLYHPDRFDGPRLDGKPVSWDEAETALADRLRGLRAAGRSQRIAMVSPLESGSLAAFVDACLQALGARRRVTFEPFAFEAIRAANRLTFGRDAVPYYAIEEANVVLSFGADFLETWLPAVEHARNFARMHALRDGRAGTLIHIEPRQSLTAANADRWIRNAPGTEGVLAMAILKAMVVADQGAGRFAPLVGDVDLEVAARESGVSVETIGEIAHAFGSAKPGLAIGGGVAMSGANATETLVAVNLLNAVAGNVGRTVRFGPDSAFGRAGTYADMAALVQAMRDGEIEVLLLANGVNPAFTLPGGLRVEEVLKAVPFVVSFASMPDETTALAHLIMPDTHWLESWGDYSPRAGVTGLLQPTMTPLVRSRPMPDVLLAITRSAIGAAEGQGPLPWASFEAYLKGAWEPRLRADTWEQALRRGGQWSDVPAAAVSPLPTAPPRPGVARLDGPADGLALIAYPSLRWYDGRSASRAWLQEAPDPMTQVAWDTWVEVPAEAASRLGIRQGDVVRVTSPHGTLELPAYVSGTLHPGAVAIPIGQHYAPYHVPRYASVAGPQNPVALLPATADPDSGGLAFLSVRVTLERTGTRRPLALLQATHDQHNRHLAQAVELGAARELELRGRTPEHANVPSMYPDQVYPGHRWGMAIDLDACTGCSACMIACQAENNVAVVGKAQAAYGRQLHWIRVERWAEGDPAHAANVFLPMLCQHCEVAPCEPVCPVFAAYRTAEGLNGQVYNRCVGTRYCGNNCPYHVRRFNWYQWEWPAPLEVQLNPDVTVRQLGVMEKCTMCLQRIIAGKDRARDAQGPLRDGDIQTACQQTCPTRAITFGDLKDPRSRVATLARSPRGYHVLEELGTRSSVTYLKKVTRGQGHA